MPKSASLMEAVRGDPRPQFSDPVIDTDPVPGQEEPLTVRMDEGAAYQAQRRLFTSFAFDVDEDGIKPRGAGEDGNAKPLPQSVLDAFGAARTESGLEAPSRFIVNSETCPSLFYGMMDAYRAEYGNDPSSWPGALQLNEQGALQAMYGDDLDKWPDGWEKTVSDSMTERWSSCFGGPGKNDDAGFNTKVMERLEAAGFGTVYPAVVMDGRPRADQTFYDSLGRQFEGTDAFRGFADEWGVEHLQMDAGGLAGAVSDGTAPGYAAVPGYDDGAATYEGRFADASKLAELTAGALTGDELDELDETSVHECTLDV